MKKIVSISFLLVAFLSLYSTATFAQKYGHLNSGNLLEQLPEVKAADKQLEEYRKQLVSKGEEMATAFQANVQSYIAKANAGDLTPAQGQEQERKLQAERQKIMEYEQEVIAKVQQKRQELLEPILKKVQDTINLVGKENGYTMIFDTSIFNAVLFAKDSDDLMPIMKKRLGIQ